MIYLPSRGSQPLLCQRQFVPAFLEFTFHFGELIGIIAQLLARFSKLLFLTLNHLIFCLELLQVCLR